MGGSRVLGGVGIGVLGWEGYGVLYILGGLGKLGALCLLSGEVKGIFLGWGIFIGGGSRCARYGGVLLGGGLPLWVGLLRWGSLGVLGEKSMRHYAY